MSLIRIRMRGFHIALNYLALLRRKYAQSGLEDLLIESGVYAAGTTSVLMLGNRGIRAHKLSMEALCRLLWKAFLEWLSKQDNGLDDQTKHIVVNRSTVEPRLSGPRLSGFLDYPDFFSSPNFVMNIH